MKSICNKTRIPYIIVTSITNKIVSLNIKLDVIIYSFNFCPTLKNMKKHESIEWLGLGCSRARQFY
jgi:hypothetical protein